MEGPAPIGLDLEWAPGNKKTAPYPNMGQELHSCDTTQIDVKTSARFAHHHARPMDNGWGPVGIYLVARSSRPRKSIRRFRQAPFTPSGALFASEWPVTSLPHRFVWFTCCSVLYAGPLDLSTVFFEGFAATPIRSLGRPFGGLPTFWGQLPASSAGRRTWFRSILLQ